MNVSALVGSTDLRSHSRAAQAGTLGDEWRLDVGDSSDTVGHRTGAAASLESSSP